ncbi:type II toxin-antitoxin system VapC family toxin [Calidithermus chliarophilus]|uniref:type II toxin-antitoxin system VapC family toxin n=1 Tax=Calidithermus chliarophilus TaxID=52023 RepID=UPI000425B21F|nr:type II toxin-antitoxin system VapC family toxin [Calidithermus chliarophilus]
MRYLLDTDICIHVARHRPRQVLERLRSLEYGEVNISVITEFELTYGALKSADPQGKLAQVELVTRLAPPLPLDSSAVAAAARIRLELERKGLRIGAYDTLIAAQALSLGLTLVTNNVREFGRVEGLRVENWLEP